MGKFQKPNKNWDAPRKKQTKKYLLWGIGAVAVLLLAVLPMLASNGDASQESQASILSATVQMQQIDTQIIGGGQLSSEASLRVRIPENVKLTQYLVGNGDVVLEGDAIAKVDRVSVMTAITQVQETLDYLSRKIADAGDDTASTSVKAQTGGTVKVIYAEEGESVQDVMLEHGALAVLSLDDVMAVQIHRETTLDVGDTVCVTFSDGTEVEGRVKTNLEGVLTVTMEDEDYSVGEKVTVTTEEGKRLGTGELYIFSPWSATGYSGRIADVLVKEDATVYIGQALFTLEDTGHTAQFQRLIDQRQEYEQLMQELFTMYRTETLTAPCDGIVTGVEEDGAFLLSGEEAGWFVRLLSSFRATPEDGFVFCPAVVEEVTAEGLKLRMTPRVTPVTDLGALYRMQVDLSAMTESWDYTGDTGVWTQDADGMLRSAGTAKAGDVLFVVGDETQVHWLVLSGENQSSLQAETTGNGQKGMLAILLSDQDTGEVLSFEDTPDEGTPDEETPDEETPDEETPDEETPDEETPDEDTPDEGTPDEDTPDEGTPDEGTPDEGTPDEGTPDEGTSDEGTSDEDNPDEDAPNDSDPDDDAPVQENPTPTPETGTVYLGYLAQVTEVAEGEMTVRQTKVPYAILDRSNLPTLSVNAGALTEEVVYKSSLITEGLVAAEDYLLLVVDLNQTLLDLKKQTLSSERGQEEMAGAQAGAAGGGNGSGGGAGGSAMGSAQSFELYSLDTLTVASVTSQEHMTVSITVDELDITEMYVGQKAVVSVDALGGEQFEAEVTGISNSGENSGGNSKFTVEITLGKRGEMLPGMYSSAFITLETREDIPCVPVAALGTDGSDTILYTSYDAQSGTLGSPVVVTIGASDGENVEILEGFAPGQTCYYEYYDTYTGSNAPRQSSGSFDLGRMLGGR